MAPSSLASKIAAFPHPPKPWAEGQLVDCLSCQHCQHLVTSEWHKIFTCVPPDLLKATNENGFLSQVERSH